MLLHAAVGTGCSVFGSSSSKEEGGVIGGRHTRRGKKDLILAQSIQTTLGTDCQALCLQHKSFQVPALEGLQFTLLALIHPFCLCFIHSIVH